MPDSSQRGQGFAVLRFDDQTIDGESVTVKEIVWDLGTPQAESSVSTRSIRHWDADTAGKQRDSPVRNLRPLAQSRDKQRSRATSIEIDRSSFVGPAPHCAPVATERRHANELRDLPPAEATELRQRGE
jgi:hypothetical protein